MTSTLAFEFLVDDHALRGQRSLGSPDPDHIPGRLRSKPDGDVCYKSGKMMLATGIWSYLAKQVADVRAQQEPIRVALQRGPPS